MHPLILIGLIVGGLLVIDVLLRFAGNKSGRLKGVEDAIDQLRRDYPEIPPAQILRVILTSDQRNAFLTMAGGMVGLVHGMGDRFVTRQLAPADIAKLEPDGQTALNILFRDVTLRSKRFEFASTPDRDFVVKSLSPA